MSPDKINKMKDRARKIEALSKDFTIAQAAKKLNLKFSQVTYICRLFGISFKKTGESTYNSKLENSDIPLIRQLNDEGVNPNQIASKFDVSRTLIMHILEGKQRCYD